MAKSFPLCGVATLAVLALSASWTPAAAQSFNCAKASTPDEVLICQNGYLASLDERMAALYFSTRNRLGGNARRQLQRDQKFWLEGRKRCGYDAACVEDAYQRRIYQLSYNY